MKSISSPISKLVALLPMKAHSARIPGKNFRQFAGKPLFTWILDTLVAIEEIELIVINTDAREILAAKGLVESDRILIRDRKSELCGDDVSMNLILADDIAVVHAGMYLMTHTTNPLLSDRTIRDAVVRYQEGLASASGDSLFSVNKYQTRFYRADGSPVNHDPKRLVKTQDLEPWYEENSNLYLFTRESFKSTGARIGGRPIMYVTPKSESVDIDGPGDWELAELSAIARVSRASA